MVANNLVYVNASNGIEICVSSLPSGGVFAAKVVLTDTDVEQALPAKFFEVEADALAYGAEIAEANGAELVYRLQTMRFRVLVNTAQTFFEDYEEALDYAYSFHSKIEVEIAAWNWTEQVWTTEQLPCLDD